jgi:superfamily I DNA/RNA helicase
VWWFLLFIFGFLRPIALLQLLGLWHRRQSAPSLGSFFDDSSLTRAQVKTLKRVFKEQFGEQAFDTVRFSSVDGVQGQEFDVVLISCVRTPQVKPPPWHI